MAKIVVIHPVQNQTPASLRFKVKLPDGRSDVDNEILGIPEALRFFHLRGEEIFDRDQAELNRILRIAMKEQTLPAPAFRAIKDEYIDKLKQTFGLPEETVGARLAVTVPRNIIITAAETAPFGQVGGLGGQVTGLAEELAKSKERPNVTVFVPRYQRQRDDQSVVIDYRRSRTPKAILSGSKNWI